jgi:hypothetical protein
MFWHSVVAMHAPTTMAVNGIDPNKFDTGMRDEKFESK